MTITKTPEERALLKKLKHQHKIVKGEYGFIQNRIHLLKKFMNSITNSNISIKL